MAVDISTIREGDEVTVRATLINRSNDRNWGLRFPHVTSETATHYVHPDCIVSHAPRALRVGDRARVNRGPREGRAVTVKALESDYAWVWVAGFGYETFFVSDLERVS